MRWARAVIEGTCFATRYNGRPRPAEVFIHPGGDIELARAGEPVS